MILGIGIDLCRLTRIERVLSMHKDAFLSRLLTPEEKALVSAQDFKNGARACAKYWAAKEAVSKALGTGIGHDVKFTDIALYRNERGAPKIRVAGGAAVLLEKMTPPRHRAEFHITITDEFPFAIAQVVLQAVPNDLAAYARNPIA